MARTPAEFLAKKRADAHEQLGLLAEEIHGAVESPIEEIMLWALLDRGGWHESARGASPWLPGAADEAIPDDENILYIEQLGTPFTSWLRVFYLQPTVRAAEHNYRIDIAMEQFSTRHPRARVFVAIECDGHDFHEKTKEQAQRDKRRDRELQAIGWLVARFTGSEIFRDPAKAAQQACELANARLHEMELAAEKAR